MALTLTVQDKIQDEEVLLRARVALMRELGVIQAWGVILGPLPPEPTRLEALSKAAESLGTPETIRDARVEAAREDFRAKLGNWELSAERIDPFLDPAIFELD